MNIILDVTRVVRRLSKRRGLTGLDRVTMAYIDHYIDEARALVRWSGRSWILSNQHSKQLFIWLKTPGSSLQLILLVFKGIITSKSITKHENTFLINTGHIGLGQSDYKRMMRKNGVKPIFFVHDLIPIVYPEYCSPGEALRHKAKIDYVLSLGHGVITNSAATLNEFVHYSQQKQKKIPPTSVALLGPGFVKQHPKKSPLSKPYFIILSTIEPRKNHLLLLHLWRKLFQKFGQQTPHLFIIGRRGWECENAIDLLERCEFLKEVITEISSCSDAELSTYLHHCQALLFPSFTEGYGLPLLEALSLGVPVIASDLPVFREIAGDIPEYLDPLDGKQWEEYIMKYAQIESSQRAAQISKMNKLTVPTWANHFSHVEAFLATL